MSNTSSSGGIGFAGLLTIALIVLQLAGFIAWSWWWVLSPLWISAGLAVGALVIIGLWMLVALLLEKRMDNRRARKRAQKLIGRK